MSIEGLRITGYRADLAPAFAALNFDWIEKYFAIEEADRRTLLDPERSIIGPGGNILFALHGDEAVGCVGLRPVRAGVFELTKMAVREDLRGAGIGAALMQAALDDARRLGAHELVLDTNSSLKNAIALYERFGFAHIAGGYSPYRRSDVSMRCLLGAASAPAAIVDARADAGVQKIAAFSDGLQGGNPAGVWIGEQLPDAATMQRIAAMVGFSETAFAMPAIEGWRVRYFSPESEVPFCGHATIALGAALALAHGDGVFALTLNEAAITVAACRNGELVQAALQSPPTRSRPADAALVADALRLFGYSTDDLDPRLPPAIAHGGADHLVLALRSRERLAAMRYDLDAGRRLMDDGGVVTICLLFIESERRFHTRNPFASGGIHEDPATGAATAALAGYLRDLGWPHGGRIDIVQGEDMGMRSLLAAEFDDVPGGSIRVSGSARMMDPEETR
jgi:PhzF family phenazine biosynthesis protein